ncbi:MAG: hypothetical protein AAF402_09295 [Pseudomonadota bacterium]
MQRERTRRKVLLSTLVAGSAITAKPLPSQWTKPIVNSVTLPAHAVASPPSNIIAPGNFQIIDCSIEAAPPVNNETINDTGFPCADLSSNDIIARPAGIEDIPGTSGDGIFRLETIKNESISDQTIDITKVVVDGRSICVNGTLSASQIPSLLQQVDLNPNRTVSGPSDNQINQGEDRVINIDRDPSTTGPTVFVGDLNSCLAIDVVSGRLNVTFTINTATTRRLLNVSTFLVS